MRMPRLGLLLVLVAIAVVLSTKWTSPKPSLATGGPSGLFGDGSDGPITFSSNTTFNPPADAVVDSASSRGTTLTLSSVSGVFQAGQKILIHQTRGTGAGSWELNTVQSYALGNKVTVTPLAHSYMTSGASAAQVLVVPQYTNVTVNNGVTVSAKAWNGSVGGILALLASGTLTVTGTISANGATASNNNVGTGGGFRGGIGGVEGGTVGGQSGESDLGVGSQGGPDSNGPANGSGGMGGLGRPGGGVANGGGGAGHGAAGTGSIGGAGGAAGGSASQDPTDLTTMLFGAGGGGGGKAPANTGNSPGGAGGNGAGIVFLLGTTTSVTGSIVSNGGNGGDRTRTVDESGVEVEAQEDQSCLKGKMLH